MQHSRVKLTWDDDEPERKKVLRRKFTDDQVRSCFLVFYVPIYPCNYLFLVLLYATFVTSIFLMQLDELDMYLASDDSASDDEGVDNSEDESLPNGGSKRKLTKEERLALLLQGDKSDEEQSDGQDMEITFNTELEDLSKRILERKNNEEKTVWEKHQEKMKEKRKARKRGLKDEDDDDDYSSEDERENDDDFFADEQSDEEPKPSKSKKHKAKAKDKAKRKGKDETTEEHLEQEATKEELELLVAGDQDAANGAKGYNLKRKKGKKGKKGKENSSEDKLPDIDLSKDERFSPMFTSHLFALDPTDPQYKRYMLYTFYLVMIGCETYLIFLIWCSLVLECYFIGVRPSCESKVGSQGHMEANQAGNLHWRVRPWEVQYHLTMLLLTMMIRNLMVQPQRSCKFCLLSSLSRGTLVLSKTQIQLTDKKSTILFRLLH